MNISLDYKILLAYTLFSPIRKKGLKMKRLMSKDFFKALSFPTAIL